MERRMRGTRQGLVTVGVLLLAAMAVPVACGESSRAKKTGGPECTSDCTPGGTGGTSGDGGRGGDAGSGGTSGADGGDGGNGDGGNGGSGGSAAGDGGNGNAGNGNAGDGDGGAGDGMGGTTPGGGRDAGPDGCVPTTVVPALAPSVMLLVDRSGSMAQELTPGIQRWQAARDALVNSATGLVAQSQTEVNFGLTLYTAPTGMPAHVGHQNTVGTADPDYTETTVCPFLVPVAIARNNFVAIEAAYRPVTMYSNLSSPIAQDRLPAGSTPTAEAIQAVIPVLEALDPSMFPGPKAIVLATDGEPNGCGPTGTPQAQARMDALNAALAAYVAGIRTFVISVGDEVGVDHLRELANTGQGFPATDPTNRFYVANAPATLAAALREILLDVKNCTFTLDGNVDPSRASTAVITIDGTPVPHGDANGWRLNGTNQIELLGTSCELIKMGAHSLNVTFPCGVQ
jgi:hypothetical protein